MLQIGDFFKTSRGHVGKVVGTARFGDIDYYTVEWINNGMIDQYTVQSAIDAGWRKIGDPIELPPGFSVDESRLTCKALKPVIDEIHVYLELLKDCDHDWALYEGLTDSFNFCKKCDQKR